MQKNNRAFLGLLLAVSFFVTNAIAKDSLGQNFWNGVGIAATAVAAGVGLAKLADWYFTETNSQLINRATKEYSNALTYGGMMNLCEETYGITRSEQALVDMAAILWDKGIDQYGYVMNVSLINSRLNELSNALHARINELRGKYLERDEVRVLEAMNGVAKSINQLLPAFNRFSHSLESNKSFFKLYDYGMKLYVFYDKEIRIIKSGFYHDTIAYDLHQAILYRHSGQKYPFIAFVNRLNADISTLKSYIRSATHSYVIVVNNGKILFDMLEAIRRIALSDDRYATELYQAEQERLERLRIEALQEQARIEHVQLSAMREQNRILERANRLKQEELYHRNHDDRNSDVTVVVNL